MKDFGLGVVVATPGFQKYEYIARSSDSSEDRPGPGILGVGWKRANTVTYLNPHPASWVSETTSMKPRRSDLGQILSDGANIYLATEIEPAPIAARYATEIVSST